MIHGQLSVTRIHAILKWQEIFIILYVSSQNKYVVGNVSDLEQDRSAIIKIAAWHVLNYTCSSIWAKMASFNGKSIEKS